MKRTISLRVLAGVLYVALCAYYFSLHIGWLAPHTSLMIISFVFALIAFRFKEEAAVTWFQVAIAAAVIDIALVGYKWIAYGMPGGSEYEWVILVSIMTMVISFIGQSDDLAELDRNCRAECDHGEINGVTKVVKISVWWWIFILIVLGAAFYFANMLFHYLNG